MNASGEPWAGTAATRHEHRARRRFGQNFLIDPAVIDTIIQAIDPQPGQRLVEIGPGLGALTAPLLSRAESLTVLEIDRDLCRRLRARAAPGLQIVCADALQADFHTLGGVGKLRIVGNLPYNVGTPLLIHLLGFIESISDVHVMLQKEVVDRLVADVGSRAYGRLGVLMQSRFSVTRLFEVPPSAFSPVPRIQSAVVRLRPRDAANGTAHTALGDVDVDRLSLVTRLAFANKRKTLRNNLKMHLDVPTLVAAGIDPGARAETLSLEQFATLARLLPTDCR